LARAAQKAGTLIFVGHIHLYNPAYHAVKKIQKNRQVKCIICEGANYGPFRSDVSALRDFAPHDISVVLNLLGTMPKTVQAWSTSVLRPKTPLYDVVYTRLSFASGVDVFISSSYLFPEKRRRVTIVGEKASIVFDDTAQKKVAVHYLKKRCPALFSGIVYIISLQEQYTFWNEKRSFSSSITFSFRSLPACRPPVGKQGGKVTSLINMF